MPYFSIEKIGPFYTWGLFLALGFLAPFIFVLKNAKNREIDPKIVWDISKKGCNFAALKL